MGEIATTERERAAAASPATLATYEMLVNRRAERDSQREIVASARARLLATHDVDEASRLLVEVETVDVRLVELEKTCAVLQARVENEVREAHRGVARQRLRMIESRPVMHR